MSSLESFNDPGDKRSRVLDHVYVDEDKSCFLFVPLSASSAIEYEKIRGHPKRYKYRMGTMATYGRLGIETMLKGTDETDVVVVHAFGRVFKLVVVEGIGAGILHERHEAGAVILLVP